jgi:LAO/AO transport system kinase
MSHAATLGAADVAAIAAGVVARDRSAVARALNLVEDRRATLREAQRGLLKSLAAVPRSGKIVGVTGPPGAGKSTLCAALARSFRARHEIVGVVAVDPSSAKSGGALLGDRLRIVDESGTPDPGLFIRSLAAGGELGGLARVAPACIDVLSAAADVVLVETVGVGQSEIDVARVADVTVLVVQPASGDALQFLKAGVLEIPDVIVIGKSDLGDVARRAETDLRHALGVGRNVGSFDGSVVADVLLVSGRTGEGVDALVSAIDARLAALRASGELARRRHEGAISRAITLIARRVGEHGVDLLGGESTVKARVTTAIDAGTPALEIAEAMVDEVVAGHRRP